MRIHEEVSDALASGRPVVALESTIISHGLPRPRNLEVAREIEAAARLKSEFLANFSHEIRTPLNGIVGYTDLVLREEGSRLTPHGRRDLNVVKSNAKTLLALINDILDLSKIEAGHVEVVPEHVELKPIVDRVGAPDYVIIGPDDPQGMLRHTEECRQRGYPFLADPSQQLAFGDGDLIRPLIDGAEILFSNEYEASLITQKTGWSAEEVLSRVGTWVVTLGPQGVRIDRAGEESILVAAVPEIEKVEPTGVGDAFRAGFLAGLAWGLSLERCAQLGSTLASYVLETVGTQEYTFDNDDFIARLTDGYGAEAGAEVAGHLA